MTLRSGHNKKKSLKVLGNGKKAYIFQEVLRTSWHGTQKDNSGGGCVQEGWQYMGNLCHLAQFCCEPKNALKNRAIKIKITQAQVKKREQLKGALTGQIQNTWRTRINNNSNGL